MIKKSLATVIVGGMLIGPIMLLVVVPALRMMFLEREHGSHASPDATQLTPAE